MEPPSIYEDHQNQAETEADQTAEEKETNAQHSEETCRLSASSSSSTNSRINLARRPNLLTRSDSIGTESESSSSRANSPMMDRNFKRVNVFE